MKKFVQIFFMTLGVIFFMLLIVGIYLFIADPFGVKPIIKILTAQSAPAAKQTNSPTTDKNPLLSPTQEKALQKIGIDPATLPTTITPAMETCFYAKLGVARANEIKAGSPITAGDYFAARSCL